MPKPEDHLFQVKRNLKFLESINKSNPDTLDWQVTVCFYAAVHLVNLHLSKSGQQYRSHTQVKQALNPKLQMSPYKFPEDEYVAYEALRSMSRRSRYLVNESELQSDEAAFTYDKHLARAIRHLDKLLSYLKVKYSINITPVTLKCRLINPSEPLKHIVVKN